MATVARPAGMSHICTMISPVVPTPPRTGNRLPALDGIRGLAILLVLLRHAVIFGGFTPQSGLDGIFNAGAKAGWVGVDLFFVLSGFLITGILFDTRRDQHYFRTFYIRRALRIVPVYYGFLLLYFVAAPLLIPVQESPALSWGGLAWAASYLSNYPTGLHGWQVLPHPLRHVWSLAIEEQFYLLWPLLIFRLPRRRLMALCLLLAGLGWVMRAGLLGAALPVAGFVWTPARLGPLALGGFVALAAREPGDLRALVRAAAPLGIVAAAVVAAILLVRRDLAYEDPVTQLAGFDALAILSAAAIVLALAAPPASAVGRCLSSPPLRFLGRYSYAIYLFHQPIILALRGMGLSAAVLPPVAGSRWPGALLFVAVSVVASVIASLASWHLWEKHFLRLKERFAYGSTARP